MEGGRREGGGKEGRERKEEGRREGGEKEKGRGKGGGRREKGGRYMLTHSLIAIPVQHSKVLHELWPQLVTG